jgi:hypothetical protein
MKNKKYVEGKKKVSTGLTPKRSSVSILRIPPSNLKLQNKLGIFYHCKLIHGT